MKYLLITGLVLIFFGCDKSVNPEAQMNKTAEAYVKLVLEVGLYDADYVDAYYGPDEWKPKEELKIDID